MDLPPPYTWRPLQATDLDEIVALNARWEEHHKLPFRGDRAEIEQDLADPAGDIATRSMAAFDKERMLGYGWVFRRHQADVPKHRALVSLFADPSCAELEDALIDWCDEAATAILSEVEDDLPQMLRAWSPDHVADRIARFEQHGYRVARYFSSLTRPVAGAADAAPPDGVTLIDWDDSAHGPSIHGTHVEAFQDHWGSIPADWESWQEHAVGDSHSRLDLSVVAVAGDEVVGYSLNQVWPEDAAVRGLTEGYIAALGVKRAWRSQGIASALILDSIRRFAADGLDNATLDTDADSLTGAFELYKRLGFEVVDTSVTLIKDL